MAISGETLIARSVFQDRLNRKPNKPNSESPGERLAGNGPAGQDFQMVFRYSWLLAIKNNFYRLNPYYHPVFAVSTLQGLQYGQPDCLSRRHLLRAKCVM